MDESREIADLRANLALGDNENEALRATSKQLKLAFVNAQEAGHNLANLEEEQATAAMGVFEDQAKVAREAAAVELARTDHLERYIAVEKDAFARTADELLLERAEVEVLHCRLASINLEEVAIANQVSVETNASRPVALELPCKSDAAMLSSRTPELLKEEFDSGQECQARRLEELRHERAENSELRCRIASLDNGITRTQAELAERPMRLTASELCEEEVMQVAFLAQLVLLSVLLSKQRHPPKIAC